MISGDIDYDKVVAGDRAEADGIGACSLPLQAKSPNNPSSSMSAERELSFIG